MRTENKKASLEILGYNKLHELIKKDNGAALKD